MHIVSRRAAALLFLLLGGCAATTVTPVYLHRSGVAGTFVYAASGRDMQVDVFGNPFNAPGDHVAQFVVDSMQGQNHGPVTHFTSFAGPGSQPGYRIVVVLEGPVSMSADAVCGLNPFPAPAAVPPANAPPVPAPAPGPAPDMIRALMVFCAKGDVMSETSGRVAYTPRPEDGNFGPLMAAMIRELIPFQDRDSDNKRDMFMRSR
jgi:hypothetical protein